MQPGSMGQNLPLQNRRPNFIALNQAEKYFVRFFTQKKIVIHLIIYSILFRLRRIKRYDLYNLHLICHMDISLDHIMF